MTDRISPEKRHELMKKIKNKNTSPELTIRKLLHSMGFRFRVNNIKLPGKPDIVLPKYKTIIFVHGCFWHSHPGCKRATIPKTNITFWTEKLRKNRLHDLQVVEQLQALGWNVLIIWECELKNTALLKDYFTQAIK